MGEPAPATTTRSPSIRLARRVLFPETEILVADLVDTAVRRRLLALAAGDAVVVVTMPETRGGNPLPIAILAHVGAGASGGMALIGQRRVKLLKAPRGSSGQALWQPVDDGDGGGSQPVIRELVTLVELSKLVSNDAAGELRASLARSRNRPAIARTADRCLAMPGLGVAFEVQALALVELDVPKRLTLLGDELRRLIEKRPLPAGIVQRVRDATQPIEAVGEADAKVPSTTQQQQQPAGAKASTKKLLRAAGSVVWGDRYVIEALLGKGGQGTTWKALDEKTGDVVALKAFDMKAASDWKKVELFEREIETLKTLKHERIPRFLDVVEEPAKHARALVMSFVPGDDLETVVSKRGPFHPDEIAAVLEQMLDVLAMLHTHAQPVVHRDVKPRNIIRALDADGGARFTLVDFGGVSRVRDSAGSTIVGTFGFMAPEQLYGAQSAATDLYALGATVASLATGKQPEELPRKGLGIDVDAALPMLPAELRRALASMLEPDPERRAKDARAVTATWRAKRSGLFGWLRRS